MPSNITIDSIVSDDNKGYFDILLKKITKVITKEYKEDRIDDADYSTVLLGSIQSSMAESMQFSLQKGIAEANEDKIRADIISSGINDLLVQANTALTDEKTKEVTQQILNLKAELDSIDKKNLLLDKELEIRIVELSIKNKDLLIRDKELAIKQAMLDIEVQKLANMIAEKAQIIANTALINKKVEEITAQIVSMGIKDLNVAENTLLTTCQIAQCEATTANLEAELTNIQDKHTMMLKQLEKIEKEILVMAQKILVETARVGLINSQKAAEDGKTSTPAGGSIKAQIDLLTDQAASLVSQAATAKGGVAAKVYAADVTAHDGGATSISTADVLAYL